GAERIWWLGDAFRAGMSMQDVHELTAIDPWFLVQIEELITLEAEVREKGVSSMDETFIRKLKRKGFADRRLATILDVTEHEFRRRRHKFNVRPVYKRVDTCAAEFSTDTAYMYSSYEEECEANPSEKKKIMVLGGGPNRIGQGIEFDYCCVHAALAMREDGYETIMVNCNPETVSTDYDTSDRLYFEPLTLEDVLEIVAVENPEGVIVHYGGQTPLKLARDLEAAGVPIIGTSPDAIDRAEDRERFQKVIEHLALKQPPNRTARNIDEGVVLAAEIGYPLVVRPSYVLGGRAMELVYNESELRRYMTEAVNVSNDAPVLLDRFLDDAIEVDVDAISDGKEVMIAGIMEHIEQAGVHSGDSACSLPAYSLSQEIQDQMREQMISMALELEVIGLMNAQFAIKGDDIYILEVNPRASRTVPFVSKATGQQLAKIAARCMAGTSLAEQGGFKEVIPPYYSIKEAVFPFNKFHGTDPMLSPEMKSTGEAMGVGNSFGEAYHKAQRGGNKVVPTGGCAIITVRDADKQKAVLAAKAMIEQGFEIYATSGTEKALTEEAVPCTRVNKVLEGRPHIVDMIKNGEVGYIVNTAEGKMALEDSFVIRKAVLQQKVYYSTTLAGAMATCEAMASSSNQLVASIQELHQRLA
ncbi:MAG: carbamoyl-phosphate synthase large subunit, partial [Gammaproteobacteria bacterium]|nr:carbamoyl-phosphate synthase large subunit [Gammaproteobacteria bacterium]